jgi:hypothetical protein
MPTVFSHIVEKRLSAEKENVATEALAYILESSEAVRRGMLKLLHTISSRLPQLRFKTQQAEGAARPDMAAFADTDTEPRVFVENKFWAGLTDNQPVEYLKRLAARPQPTLLLVIAPDRRIEALWRELKHRLDNAGISAQAPDVSTSPADSHSISTPLGPILALTSWKRVLEALDRETEGDRRARSDLDQLRALCDAADSEAFDPLSHEELSDQRAPAFVIQLGGIVQAAVELAITEKVLNKERLNPQANWERIGRYAWMPGKQGAGAWFGIHFGLWREHGVTPLWLLFSDTDWGRKVEVRALIEPWADKNGILTATYAGVYAIALRVPVREESEGVIRSIVDQLKAIAGALRTLSPRPIPSAEQIGNEPPE